MKRMIELSQSDINGAEVVEHDYRPIAPGFDGLLVHVPCGMVDWAEPGLLQAHSLFGYAYDNTRLTQRRDFARKNRRGVWVRKSPKACERALKRRSAQS